jgi:hypothetical protein
MVVDIIPDAGICSSRNNLAASPPGALVGFISRHTIKGKPSMSTTKRTPTPPPVYRPQPVPTVLQRKEATAHKTAPGPNPTPAIASAHRHVSPTQAAIQPKMATRPTNVIQLKACNKCHHNHGANTCTTQVMVDPNDATKGTRKCGCKSHSSKHDNGSKFNSKNSKYERNYEARTGQKLKT